ncbi:hypothetical protein, conserved [Trypanosoma brucei gambiense DAL972]|uniref:J domain-containing protein n=2 Tax=Trypanosoma brucei TaxID=5691 RepID=D0A1S7_TRYB9|nr:hypothetical protein, conserved [Trypanosoma brucei gambiense DAL972]RHW69374.1 DnaJ domain containing protein [Trypanosoma brucei equiperdum]CBH15220.1 hypothetical protein, conserved [Trypanosoma brucei gambiense DAL972]|eukprot:XP_011777485.1 hypothetical protein, conserved [Trypanosoma brucei gambiense DAL972]
MFLRSDQHRGVRERVAGGAKTTGPECPKLSPGRNALENNHEFSAFVNRMKAINYSFATKKKRGTEVEIITIPNIVCDGEASEEELAEHFEAESRWLDCCLREFTHRRGRYGSVSFLLVRIIIVLTFLLPALWYFWPLWEVLIDVESELHYSILGIPQGSDARAIKGAYREAVRRWHPDRNPNCDSCRVHMMKIQHAHDVLLAKGSERYELVDRYGEELAQLRSLVFFRLYNIAFYAAQDIYYLIQAFNGDAHINGSKEFSWFLQVMCRTLTMGVFTVYDTLFISGFRVIVLLQVLFYCVSCAKSSAEEWEIIGMVKRSYVDLYREAMFFAGGPLILHCLQMYQSGRILCWADAFEFFLQLAFGVIYVLSHLYHMTPNLLDNIFMKKCSIPLAYIKLPTRRLSYLNFICTEFGLLLDDLFAFSCRVPSVYRLTVIVVHTVFLCELLWFPWEPPILSVPDRKDKGKNVHREEEGKHTDMAPHREVTGEPPRAISSEEMTLLKGVDNEAVNWFDVVSTRFAKQMRSAIHRCAQQRRAYINFDLVPTVNSQEVAFVAVTREHPRAPSKVDVLFRVRDEFANRMLTTLRPPLEHILGVRLTDATHSEIVSRHARLWEENKRKNPSDTWRRRCTDSEVKVSFDLPMLSATVISTIVLLYHFL